MNPIIWVVFTLLALDAIRRKLWSVSSLTSPMVNSGRGVKPAAIAHVISAGFQA
ncbi:KPN_01571 family protein [Salmonella enterica subsp. enterica]|nr:KPN_01571 family protein [Salmonella enterica subsp. enterica]